MVVGLWIVYPRDGVANWGATAAVTAQVMREDPVACHYSGIRNRFSGLGRDPNPKLEIQFLLKAYRFHVIAKSKNRESNHPKSVSTWTSKELSAMPDMGKCFFIGS